LLSTFVAHGLNGSAPVHQDGSTLFADGGARPAWGTAIRFSAAALALAACIPLAASCARRIAASSLFAAPRDFIVDVFITAFVALMLMPIAAGLGMHIDRLRRLTEMDPLTGLFNRRHFSRRLEAEMRRAQRHTGQVSLLLVDIDRLKDINDVFGHAAGDAALIAVGDVLRTTVRLSDVAARIGGDEYAVILPETAASDALALADRLQRALASRRVGYASDPPTVSVGIAEKNCTARPEGMALFVAADEALRRAKSLGRNRAVRAYPFGDIDEVGAQQSNTRARDDAVT
jgi:diguanylate cyclase (GGDEF)-like protein